jgi:hypothetical protein
MAEARYAKLQRHLERSGAINLEMTFQEIEHVIGRKLPASARTHRAWWSNNPDNNVMTKAWLAAGFQTEDVDMAAETLNFARIPMEEKARSPAPAPQGVRDRMHPTFLMDFPLEKTHSVFSERTEAWLDKMVSLGKDRNQLIVDCVEQMVAKEIRKSLIERYEKLGLGSGSDSVALIREDRDGR